MKLVSFFLLLAATTVVGCGVENQDGSASTESAATERAPRLLRTRGRSFVDEKNRVVILRGVNLAGNSKVPPFVPYDDPSSLDQLRDFGMNVIRMPFIWEAYEPERGRYDDAYLQAMVAVARDAWQRGLYVIVDFHQDGFSRFSIDGCGSGFPSWTIPEAIGAKTPDNSEEHCKSWGAKMFTDASMHASWGSFHRNESGVRDAFLAMTSRVSHAFAREQGVIGYDLLNEPWGFDWELEPLYRDEANAIRANDPNAILFVEGHITTNAGVWTTMRRPTFTNFAYAPHYYDPVTMLNHAYDLNPAGIDGAFTKMDAKAAEWGCPLFVGELGMFASAEHAKAYVVREYENLDRVLASATQWNASPRWNAREKDGWNGEDLAIVEPNGALRPNFRPEPYPRATAGTPIAFAYEEVGSEIVTGHEASYSWRHDPHAGATEIVLPKAIFKADTKIETSGVSCYPRGNVLACSGKDAGVVSVRVTSGS